ncbi:helix-turn-helix domain-containing protein [Peptostreptococcus sp. D1]|uniref:helix-turn-helix domain-containing protein n=1 Tax=Peptostreptococcus sp. D1 TaxID=72304 RepID=UPI0008F02AB6|nr:helix-turn-helix transcriptional regulator [Peptostreptococcus sp. D1]SFE39103.1 Helix-turn-helix [Peptostreptococcus sp. D1]
MNNKEVFSKNLYIQLELHNMTRADLARTLGYPETTVSNWANAVSYPRIDKIQEMADFFGVLKSDLTEDKSTPNLSNTKKLTEKEELLLDKYNKLNDFGQTEAIKRVSELTEIEKYTTKTVIHVMAAHNDDNSPEQIELMRKDLEEMDKW